MFKHIAKFLGVLTYEVEELSKTDDKGRPLYKSPLAITQAVSAVLECVSVIGGLPGVGSAVGVLLTAVFRKKLEKWYK